MFRDTSDVFAAEATDRTVRTQRQKTLRSAMDATAFIGMALVVAASIVVTIFYS